MGESYRHPFFKARLSGDIEKCKALVGYGESQLEILLGQMSFQKLSQGTRNIILDDIGSTLSISVNGIIRVIEIFVPVIIEEEEEQVLEEERCYCSCCMAEAVVVRVGGTIRNSEGEIIFRGTTTWGDPDLHYDLDICTRKTENVMELFRVEDVRPSDYTRYHVDSQGIVLFTHGSFLDKCYSCLDCSEDFSQYVACNNVYEWYDNKDLVLLPISIKPEPNYSPALIITPIEFMASCISHSVIQGDSIKYPFITESEQNTCDTLALYQSGPFINVRPAEIKYQGRKGGMPACAFRENDHVFVILVPDIEQVDVYNDYVICHEESSMPTRDINGDTWPVPKDDVLFLTIRTWSAATASYGNYVFDCLRRNKISLRDVDGFFVLQPIDDSELSLILSSSYGQGKITLDGLSVAACDVGYYFGTKYLSSGSLISNAFSTSEICKWGSVAGPCEASHVLSGMCQTLSYHCLTQAECDAMLWSDTYSVTNHNLGDTNFFEYHIVSKINNWSSDTGGSLDIYTFEPTGPHSNLIIESDSTVPVTPEITYRAYVKEWNVEYTLIYQQFFIDNPVDVNFITTYNFGDDSTYSQKVTNANYLHNLQESDRYNNVCINLLGHGLFTNIHNNDNDELCAPKFGDSDYRTNRGTSTDEGYDQQWFIEVVRYNSDDNTSVFDPLTNGIYNVISLGVSHDYKRVNDMWDLFYGVRNASYNGEFIDTIRLEKYPEYSLY